MTCEDIFNDGKKLSGKYSIDPDGLGPLSSFKAYCDVNKRMYGLEKNYLNWFHEIFSSYKAKEMGINLHFHSRKHHNKTWQNDQTKYHQL